MTAVLKRTNSVGRQKKEKHSADPKKRLSMQKNDCCLGSVFSSGSNPSSGIFRVYARYKSMRKTLATINSLLNRSAVSFE